MAPAVNFTDTDMALIVAIFNQVGIGQIDRTQLQHDLGLPTANSAGMRLTRFKQKLAAAKGGSSDTPADDGSDTPVATPAKKNGSAKKRKVENGDVKGEVDDLNSHFEDAILHTPTRKTAGRKAKPKSFMEPEDEIEVDEELDEEEA
jgi:hypothetical protein